MLSASSTAFVGREEELAQMARLLADPACRLLTLVGPGGIGKTRLALEAAQALPGAYFVPLQPLAAPELIVSAIADTVGFQFYSGADPKQQLLDYLCEKSLLLVLDNFEHLLDGSGLLSEMLTAAPKLRLLVTSRERLNLVEEWVLDVGGLMPDSAVELFVQHASRVKTSFAFTDKDQAAVVRICRLVGGMPLALELAASWVRALSCEAIADEIAHSLDILETSTRNIEPRHRTMRAAFEPTWERLTDHERDVFMKLSVFRGGFTREAAKEVAGAALRTLSALVDKSLVKVDANSRYDVHELLRQYAAEKLNETDEGNATAQSHLDYFLKFAEQVEAHNFGREQIVWYDRVEDDLDNLRMALSRSLDTETGLRLAGALGWFLSERCHWNEGLDWLTRIIAANPDAPPLLRMKALYSAGALGGLFGDQRAPAFLEQALTLAHAANDRWNIAWALCHLAYFGEQDTDQKAALLEESLALFRELNDLMGITHTLVRRAWIAIENQQDYPYGRVLLEEASIRAHDAGDTVIAAWVSHTMGRISWLHDHDLKQAKSYLETSLALFREARFQVGTVLNTLAGVEFALGNTVRAQRLYKEGLIFQGRIMANYPHTLAGLASIATTHGEFVRAAILFGGTDTHAFSWAKDFPEAYHYGSDIEMVRAQLSEAAFAEAWAAGNAMTREQIIDYALKDADNSEADQPHLSTDMLTARELEILRLVADGLTNGEIAEQLVLAKSTIKWYINGIFSKLDATTRAQAVARAKILELLT